MPRAAGISRSWVLSLWVGAWILAGASLLAAQERIVAWGPSRDEAVVDDELVVGTGVQGTGIRSASVYEELPAPGRRLMAPRPPRLMPRSTRVSPESKDRSRRNRCPCRDRCTRG
jgi:hypothetical protein